MGECVTISVALCVSGGGIFSRVHAFCCMQSRAAELKAEEQLAILGRLKCVELSGLEGFL